VNDRLLDATEVATLLGVPVSWIRQETRAGRMPVVCLGRYRRYSREDVFAWLESVKSGSPVWRKHRPQMPA
jgi:excisionase family DNA binding protein